MKRKIEEIDVSKLNLKKWVDPRIPSWWFDPKVWDYLRREYGVEHHEIEYDDEVGDPTLVVKSQKKS